MKNHFDSSLLHNKLVTIINIELNALWQGNYQMTKHSHFFLFSGNVCKCVCEREEHFMNVIFLQYHFYDR